jgi:transcriptional regulator with XRE-family HTH domain
MVDVADTERRAFSARLGGILDDLGAPIRGRTAWLQRRWLRHTGEKLSIPTFRKWLEAQAMPKTSRIRHLAEVLGVDYEYLMTGNHSGQQVAGDTAQDGEGMYDLGRITRLADRLPLDVNVLEQCIEDIEAIIEKGRDSVSPKEKASIIAAMYLQRTLDDEQMPSDAVTALAMVIGQNAHR